ncbi:MAG TPA: ferrochelatase, partial [Pirellulaceae bacterium]
MIASDRQENSEHRRPPYDGLLLVSFGGPEARDDVLPFLRHVLRGRDVPESRLREVAEHYYHFDGKSPINEQNRRLIAALRDLFATSGPELPVYWGNRNWHPFLADTIRAMRADGVSRSLGFVTSAFSSYSGCRQYLEDLEQARADVGAGAPQVDKIRAFGDHPGFIHAMSDRVSAALTSTDRKSSGARQVIFTAHSIPLAMAQACAYERQLRESCRLVAARVQVEEWSLAFQSRSGPPSQPWLEPDIGQALTELARAQPGSSVVVAPIGFLSDHMEVLYDLDVEARALAESLGLSWTRAETVGTHSLFVEGIRQLVLERMEPHRAR